MKKLLIVHTFAVVALLKPGLSQAESASELNKLSPLELSPSLHSTSDPSLPDANEKVLKALKLIVDGFGEDRERIESLLIEATRISPRNVNAYALMTRYLLWQIANGSRDPSDLHRASFFANHVRELEPDRPLGIYLACEVQLAMGQSQLAFTTFNHAKVRYPDHLDTLAFEARYFSDSNPTRSLESAKKALKAGHPMDDLSPSIAHALLTAARGKRGAGASSLAQFAEQHPDRWLWHRAGKAYQDEEMYKEASQAFHKSISLGNTLESRLQLGILQYTRTNKPAEGLGTLETLRKELRAKSTRNLNSESLVTAHIALAHLVSGNHKVAVQEAQQAIRQDSSNASVIVGIMEEFNRRQLGHELKGALLEAVSDNPFLEYGHITLGNLAMNKQDFHAASTHFSHALALSPERDDIFSARAHARYRASDYIDALADFDKAISLRPDQATHHYNRACMLTLLNRNEEAMASLEHAFRINRKLVEVAKTDSDLANLRKDLNLQPKLGALGLIPEPEKDQISASARAIP